VTQEKKQLFNIKQSVSPQADCTSGAAGGGAGGESAAPKVLICRKS